ncbi:MAG: hypothetical protein JWO60_1862 [Frankiales bacterium]|nr:hypothetical protein [Frankiales bacterium]
MAEADGDLCSVAGCPTGEQTRVRLTLGGTPVDVPLCRRHAEHWGQPQTCVGPVVPDLEAVPDAPPRTAPALPSSQHDDLDGGTTTKAAPREGRPSWCARGGS